ncbi:MAG TPA: protein kinase [Polyangiaceae bacterium]|nr:protein kinase [Polyangiaceae bacterium]
MSESPLRAGALIAGRYLLEQQLGEGGMGTVWEATHTVTRRSVAMKFLKESLRNKPELRQRFLREASAASALRHPHVVEILDVFDFEERMPVLVMELLRGETLGSKLLKDERLSLEETAALVLPVVSAVGAAHALGIVHRDLKPENVFLVHTGNEPLVKVLDFGIAKLMTEQYKERGASALHTDTGSMLGTPSYMAPEQATGEGIVDHRVDVWSVGVILYECLSGMRPIEGDNLAQVVTRLVSAAIIPLENLAPQLPHEVTTLVMQMLTRDPVRRAPDLLEIGRVLGHHTRVQVPSFGPPAAGTDRTSLPPSLQPAPPRVSSPPRQSLGPAPGRVQVVASPGVDPRGSTLLSSPPSPSSVTVHVDESDKSASAPGRRRAIVAAVALALVGAFVVAFRLQGKPVGEGMTPGMPTLASSPPSLPSAAAPAIPPTPAEARPPVNEPAASARRKPGLASKVPSPHGPNATKTIAERPTAVGAPATSAAATDEDSLFRGRK